MVHVHIQRTAARIGRNRRWRRDGAVKLKARDGVLRVGKDVVDIVARDEFQAVVEDIYRLRRQAVRLADNRTVGGGKDAEPPSVARIKQRACHEDFGDAVAVEVGKCRRDEIVFRAVIFLAALPYQLPGGVVIGAHFPVPFGHHDERCIRAADPRLHEAVLHTAVPAVSLLCMEYDGRRLNVVPLVYGDVRRRANRPAGFCIRFGAGEDFHDAVAVDVANDDGLVGAKVVFLRERSRDAPLYARGDDGASGVADIVGNFAEDGD